jgi:uncharacterized membrane protein YdjX (TVP38/TMEM64 family)
MVEVIMLERRVPPRRAQKIAAVAAVLVLLAVAHRLGVFERLRDPQRLAATLLAMGAWGYVAFVASYAAFQPFGVPGTCSCSPRR